MALLGNYVYIALNGVKIAGLKSCKVSNGCKTIEVASATSGQWEEFIAARKSWKMSCSYLVLAPATMNTNILRVGATYSITFTNGSATLSGSAICVKSDADAPIAGLCSGSFEFQGSGALTY